MLFLCVPCAKSMHYENINSIKAAPGPLSSMEFLLYGHSSLFALAAGAIALYAAVRFCQALNTNWKVGVPEPVLPFQTINSSS